LGHSAPSTAEQHRCGGGSGSRCPWDEEHTAVSARPLMADASDGERRWDVLIPFMCSSASAEYKFGVNMEIWIRAYAVTMIYCFGNYT